MKKVENFKYRSDSQEGDCCPECNAAWDGGDIYEHFLEAKFNPNSEQHPYYKDMSIAEVKKAAGSYGWTEKTPRRFNNVIGVDLSMDPDAKGDDQYDGVSYWQCPECEIAWHRFKGTRTERFVKAKEVKMSVPEGKEFNTPYPIPEIEEEEPTQIIYNAIQTPDGTIIESVHRHDYVTHKDKNGKTYAVDGGHDYLKRMGDSEGCKDLSMYVEPWTPEYHEKARKVVKRGGRGKDGRQPLTWVPICEMNDNWVAATIVYNIDRGFTVKDNWVTELLSKEVEYRKENNIKIEE